MDSLKTIPQRFLLFSTDSGLPKPGRNVKVLGLLAEWKINRKKSL